MPRLSSREPSSRSAFTLVELLVVIAIIAILAVVVILVINPVEMLRQARDSNRIADLATLNKVLGIYNTDQPSASMGSATVVYVSIPDSSGTCANLGLPTLPSGYTYNCATTANYRKPDGTGWIPVNFTSVSFGSPLGTLPVDPQNTTTTMYYTYVPGGSWQLSARLESQKYQPKAALTNNYDPGLYVQGNDTDLAPFVGGLVGWWKFDEGSGTSVTDSSGWGRTGSMFVGAVATDLHTSSGCRSGACAVFDQPTDDYVSVGTVVSGAYSAGVTVLLWVKWDGTGEGGYYSGLFNKAGETDLGRLIITGSTLYFDPSPLGTSGVVPINQWVQIGYVYNKANGTNYLYINGQLIGQGAISARASTRVLYFGRGTAGATYSYGGLLDDIKVYYRALSAIEILAMYNATR